MGFYRDLRLDAALVLCYEWATRLKVLYLVSDFLDIATHPKRETALVTHALG